MYIKYPGRNEFRRLYNNSVIRIALYHPKSKYPFYSMDSGCLRYEKRNMSGEARIRGRHFRPMKYYRTYHIIPGNPIRSRAIQQCRNTLSANGIWRRRCMESWSPLHAFVDKNIPLSQAWIEEDDEY